MADSPSVLFISCSDVQPEEIIKLVLNVPELPDKVQIDEFVSAFPWLIDNKYYTAQVRLCSLQKKSIINKKFADSVEAVVVHFDNTKKSQLEDVERWLPFISQFQPEIKILLCKNIQNDDNPLHLCKQSVQEWCIGKGFELVELEPIVEEVDNELEDDFQETTGVKRIIQALNAHVWPNLIMKNSTQTSNVPKLSVDHAQAKLINLQQDSHLEETLEEMLEKGNDFSDLFSQLSEMKARVSSLSGSERKAAAEEVVKAFWKALNEDGVDDDDYDGFLDL